MSSNNKYESTDDKYVKILFHLEKDEDGYPPEEWESLWATYKCGNLYKIDNIPFYVPLLSCGDVVRVKEISGELHFDCVQEYSENSTIRVIVFDVNNTENIRNRLVNIGCSVEKSGIPGFIAVNIPPDADSKKVLSYLERGHQNGEFDYEESSLRF